MGNKAVQTSGLRLVAFTPAKGAANDAVTAEVVNLPASATETNTYLVFTGPGGAQSLVPKVTTGRQPGSSTSRCRLGCGDYQVTLVAPDISAGPYPFTIT